MRRPLWPLTLCLAAGLAPSAGCKSSECKPNAPGFELVVKAGTRGPELRSLEVAVTLGADRRKRTFDLASELQDGDTSLWIQLDPAPTAAFTVRVDVSAFAATGATGPVVVNAAHEFRGEPDACNRFELVLADPQTDAGLLPTPDATPGEDAGDAGVEPTPDAAGPDAAPVPVDTGVTDVGVPDTGLPDTGLPDSGAPDTGAPDGGLTCAQVADPDTIALYRFQNNLADETGDHPGTLGGMNVTYGAGPRGCGSALVFPQASSLQGWARVPDAPELDLPSGSVDLWVNVDDAPPFGNAMGIVSRDAAGTSSTGHFTLYVSCEGYLVARLEANGTAYHQCTTASIRQNVWSYAVVNFGAPGLEVWLDGVQGTRTGDVHLGDGCNVEVTCGTTTNAGIDGNDNAWILGAAADLATDGATLPTPLHLPLRRGKLDSLRISSIRR